MTNFIRWIPNREMAAIQSAMDSRSEAQWRYAQSMCKCHSLALDVYETDADYTVIAVLPGLNADDIAISLHDGGLTITADIAVPEVNDTTRVLLQERAFGEFSRSINLPQPVVYDSVEATYENGILKLTLPKTPESQPHQISIKVNGTLKLESAT